MQVVICYGQNYSTAGNDAAYGIVQTADSGYVFSGNELTYGINGFAHLVKTDKNGNVVWSKTFGNSIRKNYIFRWNKQATMVLLWVDMKIILFPLTMSFL